MREGCFLMLFSCYFFGGFMGAESDFQSKVKDALEERFPGCIILKNDPTYIQGIPDLTIFFKNKWATLEVKASKNSSHRPNQDYYVNTMREMSYSAFIYPENFEEVLDDIQRAFES